MSLLTEAIHSKEPVTGYTHDFYRYPARFSPSFARAIIENFTKPGETVLDPFMGSGTTLVEARATSRHAIGTDISSLAVFLAQVKTTLLSGKDIECIRAWSKSVSAHLNLRNSCEPSSDKTRSYYQRNISGRSTWPIRKTLELALNRVNQLHTDRQRKFARCALLRTAQWALDCRTEIPKAHEVRRQLLGYIQQMLAGTDKFGDAVRKSDKKFGLGPVSVQCRQQSVIGIETDPLFKMWGPPKLILTSPPYPGVHVLYHRWQVLGRKETPAPFWIAGSRDGHGASFYTFGDRNQQELTGYFRQAYDAFQSLARISGPKTVIVQMLAFSEPSWQLEEYLDVMKRAGLAEIKFSELANSSDGRTWREVPHRKWYATQKGNIGASSEVVLFHRLS
jgi:DNA methylase